MKISTRTKMHAIRSRAQLSQGSGVSGRQAKGSGWRQSETHGSLVKVDKTEVTAPRDAAKKEQVHYGLSLAVRRACDVRRAKGTSW